MGAPPYVHLDDPTPSPPMYNLLNLLPQAFAAISHLLNLVYPSASQPTLGKMYFFTSTYTPNPDGPLAYYLQVRLVSDKFEILEMPMFELDSDPTSHVVDNNIHMNFCITFEGLKCQAFPTTLDEQDKIFNTKVRKIAPPNAIETKPSISRTFVGTDKLGNRYLTRKEEIDGNEQLALLAWDTYLRHPVALLFKDHRAPGFAPLSIGANKKDGWSLKARTTPPPFQSLVFGGIVVEWICWLSGQRKKAPTPEEMTELEARRERVRHNVARMHLSHS
ncbi:hypothetical protein ACLOJK_039422 [Asimina triloba]